MLSRHNENIDGRDFVVGDIHGQYRLLNEALERVNFDKRCDRLFSVGDLIDRGADSFDCLSLAFEPWFFGVRGNHELLAQDAFASEEDSAFRLWLANGGSWVLAEDLGEVKQILGEALRHLPYAREVAVAGKRIGLVHAEPPEDWGLIEQRGHDYQHSMVWGRSRIKSRDTTPVAGIDAVAVGHTIVDEPLWLGNVLHLDTGAFHTGKLTLLPLASILDAAPTRSNDSNNQ